MTIYHAVIHTMTEAGTIPHGFLTVENGKITRVQTGDPDVIAEGDMDAGEVYCCRVSLMPIPILAFWKTDWTLRG